MSMSKNFFSSCENKGFVREYSRGKSFDFSAWSPAASYVNDLYRQDFVIYEKNLYACIKSNTNTKPDESSNWLLVSEALPGITFVPHVDENGNLTWTEQIGKEAPKDANIIGPKGDQGEKGDKGDKGDKGEKGDKGDRGIDGEKGERGEKGDQGDKGDQGEKGIQGDQGEKGDKGDKGDQGEKGDKGDQGERGPQGIQGERGESNFRLGLESPESVNGLINDVYLDLSSGIFYQFDKSWTQIGQISVEGSDINLEWQDD